jgi:4-carboxymuconolactone decarboxylase
MRLRRGGKPGGLGRVESVAFDVAVELAGGKGPLGRERWDEVVECVGREGALKLVQVCGLYGYTCLLLNGCDVRLPEGERIWE